MYIVYLLTFRKLKYQNENIKAIGQKKNTKSSLPDLLWMWETLT